MKEWKCITIVEGKTKRNTEGKKESEREKSVISVFSSVR